MLGDMVFAVLCLEAWHESSNFTKLHLNGWLVTNNKHAVGDGSTINAKCIVDQQFGWLPVGPPPLKKTTMPYFRGTAWSWVNFDGPSWACVGPLNNNNDFFKANIFTYIWSIFGSLRFQWLFPMGICRSRKSHWEHNEPKRGTWDLWGMTMGTWWMGQLFGGLDGMRPSSSTRDGMGEYSEDRFSKPWDFLTLGWGSHGKIPPKSVPHGHVNIPTAKG